jgi:phage tail-like protein
MIKPNLFQIFARFILNDKTGYAMCKALEAGYSIFLKKIEEGLDIVLDPDKMPEWRLDEAAWEYNIPYDYRADVERKREWVRRAIPMYRILGTREGIRQYLEGYFGEIEIQENWEYAGDPFHFRVTVGGEWTPETEAWAVAAIERTKPVRSVLDDFRIGCQCRIAIDAIGVVKDRFRFPSAGEIVAGEYPEENHRYIIDPTMQAAIRAIAERFEVVYEMAGDGPEINHLYTIDESMRAAIGAEEMVSAIGYPMVGETIAGEGPEVNRLFVPDSGGNAGDETEEIARTIYYPLCGDVICGQ